MKLLDVIFEVVVTNKEMLGKGKDHVVYDYKSDPTKVIKSAWGVNKGEYNIVISLINILWI